MTTIDSAAMAWADSSASTAAVLREIDYDREPAVVGRDVLKAVRATLEATAELLTAVEAARPQLRLVT